MRSFTIRMGDIMRCPKQSLAAEHYNTDGTCRCDEEREARTAHPVAYNTQDLRDGRILGHATTAVGALRHASKFHLLNPRREYVSVKLVDVPDFISATNQAERYWQIGVHLKERTAMSLVVDQLEDQVVESLPGDTPQENAEYLRQLIQRLTIVADDLEDPNQKVV